MFSIVYMALHSWEATEFMLPISCLFTRACSLAIRFMIYYPIYDFV